MLEYLELLGKYLGPKTLAVVAVCGGVVFIWYQHLRTKFLKEQLEFEKHKGERFRHEVESVKASPTSEATAPRASQERVLVVDDEEWLRQMLVLVMRQALPSVQVDEAENGNKAMEVIENKKPSVLISDIMMPGLDGIELLKRLQAQNKSVPTLLISGYASPDGIYDLLAREGISDGARVIFLAKPFEIDDFIRALNKLRSNAEDTEVKKKKK